METELAKLKSELENFKLLDANTKLQTINKAFDKIEYEFLLEEKDSKIQEYLKIINEKDAQILSQKPCCPVCLTDLDENKKMIAFYNCGHRACSKCFDELPVTNKPLANKPGTTHDFKQCPICKAWISRGVTLADT